MVGLSHSIKGIPTKIVNGEKLFTIRPKRKRKWKDTDILNHFWKQRTSEGFRICDVPLDYVKLIHLKDITPDIAIRDGFNSYKDCINYFETDFKEYIHSDKYQGFEMVGWLFEKCYIIKKCSWCQKEMTVYLKDLKKIGKQKHWEVPDFFCSKTHSDNYDSFIDTTLTGCL